MNKTGALRTPALERCGWIAWPMVHALVGALAVAGTASAQVAAVDLADVTLEQLMGLEVVTASRRSERVADAPSRVHVITQGQIRRRGYRSLIDVLKDLSDFKVDVGGDSDYPIDLTVQGSRGANLVIVLLNGVRISSPTNEPLPILANYPVHSARQIEILYGPASALYGADAFSGVINIITRNGYDNPGLEVETSIGQYGLYNYSGSYAGRVGQSGSLLIAGQLLRDQQPDLSRFYPDDYQGLRGQQTGAFNTIFGPMQAIGTVSPEYDNPLSAHSVHAQLRLGGWQFSLFENDSRVPTASAYTPDNAIFNDAAFNRNTLVVGSGSFTKDIGRVTSTSTVTMSRHELDPQSGYWNVFSNMQKSFKYAYGSMLKGEQQLLWKPAANATLTTGATFERFFSIPQGADVNAPVESRSAPGTILGTDITDDFNTLRYSNVGAYVELQQAIVRGITATLGGRVDRSSRFGATFNPRLGVVMKPGHAATTVKVLYSTAYLAPSPYQAYGHYGSFYSVDGGQTYQSEYWHLPNPDLKPQRKKTLEVNLLQGLSESIALSFASFYSQLTDKIQESDPDRAYAGLYKGWPVSHIDFPVNEGSESTYGATIGVDVAGSLASDVRVNARAALSIVDGRTFQNDPDGTTSTLEVGGMVPVQFRFGVDIRGDAWSLAPRVTVSGPQRLRARQPFPNEVSRRELDGYTTVDLTARRQDVFKELDIFATVENVFDARYRNINMRAYLNPEELVGAPQNPRRLTVGVQIQVR
jgi:outer membrane receptor for ferrienterochelin and colicin